MSEEKDLEYVVLGFLMDVFDDGRRAPTIPSISKVCGVYRNPKDAYAHLNRLKAREEPYAGTTYRYEVSTRKVSSE